MRFRWPLVWLRTYEEDIAILVNNRAERIRELEADRGRLVSLAYHGDIPWKELAESARRREAEYRDRCEKLTAERDALKAEADATRAVASGMIREMDEFAEMFGEFWSRRLNDIARKAE